MGYNYNGKLKSETEFVQGVHKVRTVMYHENGHKASEGAYIDQQKDGEWRYYSERDTLIKIENYKLGKRNGLEDLPKVCIGAAQLQRDKRFAQSVDSEALRDGTIRRKFALTFDWRH